MEKDRTVIVTDPMWVPLKDVETTAVDKLLVDPVFTRDDSVLPGKRNSYGKRKAAARASRKRANKQKRHMRNGK